MYCTQCGRQRPPDYKFCPECGAAQAPAQTAPYQHPYPHAPYSQVAIQGIAVQQHPYKQIGGMLKFVQVMRVLGIISMVWFALALAASWFLISFQADLLPNTISTLRC
ncbi:MAG: zinc-ribbon domain-containing protein [Oscillospiraceae bacterium]|nr:zinc-ribbon domain-containing protein [Oscillospiraceae bacterium]